MNLQKEGCCFALCSPQVGFPWVVQLDCSEDANTYIHRVGRTARYEDGKASLFLLPSGNFILDVPPDEEDLHCQIQVNPIRSVYVLLDYLQSNSRFLMHISSQQPSRPTHEEVDVLTVKRVIHSEQLAEEVRKIHI